MKKILNKVFCWDNLGATLFVLLVIWIVSYITINPDGINPIQDMLADFEITDLVASNIRDEAKEDTNIVIVNIGNLSRADIAKELNIINECGPKVIGIDAFFKQPLDPVGDRALAEAFMKTKNLVLVSKLLGNDSLKIFDSLQTSHPMFLKNAHSGYANLITEGEEKFRTARTFSPLDTIVKGKAREIQHFFALKVADLYLPQSSSKFIERRKKGYIDEIIWYKGNIYGQKCKYLVIDAQDILESYFLKENLKDKIVLMGYLGDELLTSEGIWDVDKFFTPLNPNYVGKAVPDMFGIVVHANIISMMLYDTYVDVAPQWINFFLGFLLCYSFVVLFHVVLEKIPRLFDPITKILQFLIIALIIMFEAFIYMRKAYKFDFTMALFAIALVPDLLEIYLHLIRKFGSFLIKKIYIKGKN